MEAIVVVLFVTTLVILLRAILREQEHETREEREVAKLVYLTAEEIEKLEAIADRIDTFGHTSDASMLRNMVVSG